LKCCENLSSFVLSFLTRRMSFRRWLRALAGAVLLIPTSWAALAFAEGPWEVTPESETALRRGLAWLAKNQGPEGNWESNDLGLVSVGALAFLSAGHTPGHGKYGAVVDKALDYVL